MQLLVFITDDGTADGSGPVLFLLASPEAALPKKPRSFEWRYFATIDEADSLAISEPLLTESIAATGYHIARRLI
ncbi:MAG: hypothetical protein JWQ89_572 [Devosia sp.]|uniref:hypothetical protein n=1 Tax=Devosia sp. TaxID=1871048 RepID=UPI002637BCA8|nr:hypothetical protein [Devosia sp.]MDB5538845.1 hypothetical protein [Devosia sp.]